MSRQHLHRNVRNPSRPEIIDDSQVLKSTSSFTLDHLDELKIFFINTNSPEEFLSNLCQYQLYQGTLLTPELDENSLRQLSDHLIETRYSQNYPLIKLLTELVTEANPREWKTDTFISYLMNAVGFGQGPFIIDIKPHFSGKIGNRTITSIPDYGLRRREVTFLVNENKKKVSSESTNNFGEPQVAGETLIVAQNNEAKTQQNTEYIVLAMRAIGTKITFYRSIYTTAYINEVRSTYPLVDQSAFIYRYPAEDYNIPDINRIRTLDYLIPTERQIILSILTSLREYIHNH